MILSDESPPPLEDLLKTEQPLPKFGDQTERIQPRLEVVRVVDPPQPTIIRTFLVDQRSKEHKWKQKRCDKSSHDKKEKMWTSTEDNQVGSYGS